MHLCALIPYNDVCTIATVVNGASSTRKVPTKVTVGYGIMIAIFSRLKYIIR